MYEDHPPSPAMALLRRELLVLSRNQRLFGTVAAMTGFLVIATVVLILWADSTHASMANFARNLFSTQFFLLFATALIVVPGAAAASMVSEQRQDCFPLLYTTLIPPAWIVWSKALAMAGLYAGFFIGLLPFSGLVYFFAGMETDALMYSAIVLFSLALGTASIGLMASCWAANHGRALYLSGMGVAAMVMFPVFLRTAASILPLPSMPWLEYMGPTRAFSLVTGGLSGWVPCLFFAAYQVCVATVALLIARRRVLPGRSGWRERLGNRAVFPTLPVRARHRPLIGDGQNPIAAKERMVSTIARGYRPHVLGLVGLVAGMFFALPNYLGGGAAGSNSASMTGFIIWIVLPPIMAIQFMAEREQDMWDPLRCSLLSGRDVVRGKLGGVWIVLRPLILGLIAGELALYVGAFMTGAFPGDLPSILVLLIGVVRTLLGFCTTSVFALFGASHRKTMTSAIVMAYVASFGLPMLASIPTSMLFGLVTIMIRPDFNPSNNDFMLVFQIMSLAGMLFNAFLAYLIYLSTVRVVESKLAASR